MLGPAKRNPNLIVFWKGSDHRNPKEMLHLVFVFLGENILLLYALWKYLVQKGTIRTLFSTCSCTVSSPPYIYQVTRFWFVTTVSRVHTSFLSIFQPEIRLHFFLLLDRMLVREPNGCDHDAIARSVSRSVSVHHIKLSPTRVAFARPALKTCSGLSSI